MTNQKIETPTPVIRVIAGDNLFTYILSRHILKDITISSVILSNYSNGSVAQIFKIFKKTSLAYFLYRTTVQIISKCYSRYSIRSWAEKNNTPIFIARSKRDLQNMSESNYMTIAFNFDIIVPEDFIASSSIGVLNIHASDLPLDKGISPVVWAYCRGDEKICTSFYLMDGGIDSGIILKKISLNIETEWSLFRTYCEVLDLASKEIINVIKESQMNSKKLSPAETSSQGNYNSWPSPELHKRLKNNKRHYFNFRDIEYLNQLLSKKL
jgi:folate-dependent phosphoribosylglycinamide formyltransferase PurN